MLKGRAGANKRGRLSSEIAGVNLPCCFACHLHVCLALVSVSYAGCAVGGARSSLTPVLKQLRPGPQVGNHPLSPTPYPTGPAHLERGWWPLDAGK